MITRILIAASLVGCAAEEPGVDEMQEQPQPEEQPEPPAPMSVSIDWGKSIESGGGLDVTEVAVMPLSYGGGQAVLQLKLSGSVTAPGGTAMKLRINNGTGWWEYGGLKSKDFESASCGSWQASSDLLHGLICTAPGSATSSQTTTWSYSMAEKFEIEGTPDAYSYSGAFHVEIFDITDRIECRDLQLDVSRSDELGGGSSFENGPCE